MRPWINNLKKKMTKKDKRRVAANKMKKKYRTATKKVRANGTISVPVPKDLYVLKTIMWFQEIDQHTEIVQ